MIRETDDAVTLQFAKPTEGFDFISGQYLTLKTTTHAINYYTLLTLFIKSVQKNIFFKEYENQTHVWLLTDINSEKSKEALNDIAEFVSNY